MHGYVKIHYYTGSPGTEPNKADDGAEDAVGKNVKGGPNWTILAIDSWR